MGYASTKKMRKKSYVSNLESQIRFMEAFLKEEDLQTRFEDWVAKKVEEKTKEATEEAIKQIQDGES